jgi:hypothetical protein
MPRSQRRSTRARRTRRRGLRANAPEYVPMSRRGMRASAPEYVPMSRRVRSGNSINSLFREINTRRRRSLGERRRSR